jgi:hypothetical protein
MALRNSPEIFQAGDHKAYRYQERVAKDIKTIFRQAHKKVIAKYLNTVIRRV